MIFKQADSPNKATCVTVGVYAEALTYGKTYEILASDEDKNQVKVQGDNGRTRWYPCGCFDMTGRQVPRLLHIRLNDLTQTPFTSSVEVDLEFSNGQRRWCYFITPEMLSHLGGNKLADTERLLSYATPHMVVVSAISLEVIEQALNYIESQGQLLDSTKLIE